MNPPSETTPDARVAYLELAALPTAAFWARWQTRIVLDWWGIRPEAAETAVLLVSEMVTNASKASMPGLNVPRNSPFAITAIISLTLTHLGQDVRIEVGDPNTEPPVLCDTGPDAEAGRGLVLVEAMSHEWSYYYPPTGGKVVYALIDVSSAHDTWQQEATQCGAGA